MVFTACVIFFILVLFRCGHPHPLHFTSFCSFAASKFLCIKHNIRLCTPHAFLPPYNYVILLCAQSPEWCPPSSFARHCICGVFLPIRSVLVNLTVVMLCIHHQPHFQSPLQKAPFLLCLPLSFVCSLFAQSSTRTSMHVRFSCICKHALLLHMQACASPAYASMHFSCICKHVRALLLYMHICQYLRLQDQCHDPPHLQPIRSIKTTSFPDLCLTCGVAQIQAQAQDCNLGTDTHLRTHTTLAILS